MLKKYKITSSCCDLIILDEFIKKNPNALKTFRYFTNRPYSIIKNQIVCNLYSNDIEYLGYGHLEKENNKIWLGIMVSDTQVGKKYGNQIMDDLISQSDEDIYLSVDKNNLPAIKLYKNKNFEIIDNKENNFIMKLKI